MERKYRLNVPMTIYGTQRWELCAVKEHIQKTKENFPANLFFNSLNKYKGGVVWKLTGQDWISSFHKFFKNSKLYRLMKIFSEATRILVFHKELLTEEMQFSIAYQYKISNHFNAICLAIWYQIQYYDKDWLLECWLHFSPEATRNIDLYCVWGSSVTPPTKHGLQTHCRNLNKNKNQFALHTTTENCKKSANFF